MYTGRLYYIFLDKFLAFIVKNRMYGVCVAKNKIYWVRKRKKKSKLNPLNDTQYRNIKFNAYNFQPTKIAKNYKIHGRRK